MTGFLASDRSAATRIRRCRIPSRAREIGEIEVRAQPALNDKLHDPFSVTVDLF